MGCKKFSLKYSLTSILYISTMAYTSQILLLIPDFFIDDYRVMDNICINFLFIKLNTANDADCSAGKSLNSDNKSGAVAQLALLIIIIGAISLFNTYFFLKAIEEEDIEYFDRLYEYRNDWNYDDEQIIKEIPLKKNKLMNRCIHCWSCLGTKTMK